MTNSVHMSHINVHNMRTFSMYESTCYDPQPLPLCSSGCTGVESRPHPSFLSSKMKQGTVWSLVIWHIPIIRLRSWPEASPKNWGFIGWKKWIYVLKFLKGENGILKKIARQTQFWINWLWRGLGPVPFCSAWARAVTVRRCPIVGWSSPHHMLSYSVVLYFTAFLLHCLVYILLPYGIALYDLVSYVIITVGDLVMDLFRYPSQPRPDI